METEMEYEESSLTETERKALEEVLRGGARAFELILDLQRRVKDLEEQVSDLLTMIRKG